MSGHKYCDICAKAWLWMSTRNLQGTCHDLDATEDENPSFESVRSIEENDKVHLRTELFNYMKNLRLHHSSGAACGFCKHDAWIPAPLQIKHVLDNCNKIKILQHVETFVEVWRRGYSWAILSVIHQVFGDVHSDELEAPESEDENMEEFAQEWTDIRDDSELFQLLSESDLLNVDFHMEDIDQSGIEEVNMSSVIANRFEQQIIVNIIRDQAAPNCKLFSKKNLEKGSHVCFKC